jgi:hypothetical protein
MFFAYLIAFPWNLELGFWNLGGVAVLDMFLFFMAVPGG